MPRSVTITITHDGLLVDSPYNQGFIEYLKATVPADKRTWAKPNWHMGADYLADMIVGVIEYYGTEPIIIDESDKPIENVQRTFEVHFVGRCKPKVVNGKMESLANGYANNGWNVLFEEQVLKDFFLPKKPARIKDTTYYDTLCISQKSTPEEIKKSYRRLARQWHPDYNPGDKEAEEMFKKINEANEVLSDVMRRKKYDFILSVMEKTDGEDEDEYMEFVRNMAAKDPYGYRPPVMCGRVTGEGHLSQGRFLFTKIMAWEEITNLEGKVMVSTWKKDNKSFTIYWV